MNPASIGIVVIGRNEGERLRRCLAAVSGLGATIVYVDSGSTDGSVRLATDAGADVVDLDMSRPFTAARARNAGFRRLLELAPETEFVQFVDGDTVLDPQWLARGEAEFPFDSDLAIVCGRLGELAPDASIYNRLADLEWDAPVGDVQSCGGIFMARVACMRDVGGFRDDIVAGEEPDLCSRLLQRGHRIRRLPFPMALHDMGMTRFRQWWRRATRTGHAYAESAFSPIGAAHRHHWRDSLRAVFWGGVWPACMLGSLVAAVLMGGGWWIAPAVTGALALLNVARTTSRRRRTFRTPWRHAALYAGFCLLAKPAHLQGIATFLVARVRGRRIGLIEYRRLGERTPEVRP